MAFVVGGVWLPRLLMLVLFENVVLQILVLHQLWFLSNVQI